uniref:Chitin-binding type-2 domain-containing protein n=1 Tax=Anopheles farauti TaxID=69004 RepID=A0A182QA10_9DIPT
MNARHQRWMRQRTALQLFMVTAMCIMGLEGTMIRPGPPARQTKDSVAGPQRDAAAHQALDPLLAAGSHANLTSADRHRRLIPYMQYYVTSTAAPAGADNADYQPSFNQLYNYRPIPVKVVSVGGSNTATSYAVLNTASTGDDDGPAATGGELYERPKYAVIPRERDPSYEPPRFAVVPQKLYGVEVHPKHQAEDDVGGDLVTGGKYFLSPSSGDVTASRKPTLYQTVPVYKKSRINPFLPSNTIPGPFTPMTGGSSSSSSGGSTVNTQHKQQPDGGTPITYVKAPVTEQPAIYSSYDHGGPVQDNRGHGEMVSSPYVVVKTVPKFYYEKPRISVSTPAPTPYQIYYKEKPSEGRKQHSNHSGYTRPRIPGVVPVRLTVDPHTQDGREPEQPVNQYYTIGQQLYKVQEHAPPIKLQTLPPPRQHLTETILPQHQPPKGLPTEPIAGKNPAHTGQYFLGPNYKVYKVPIKSHHAPSEQSFPYAHPQMVVTYSSTTPRPVSYSTTPSVHTTAGPPVHETPLYPVYHHHASPKPPARNRTEYRQRFYPQSMRHPNQHKPRPIPLAPVAEREQVLGLPPGTATASLSDLLKNLQDSNLLPKTLTPDNIDNSIRTLVKILNNLKANGHHRPEVERPELIEPAYEPTNYTTVEPETYVDTDKYRAGPPMLINKIVTPGPNTGKPGIDYPALSEIPETSFKCKDQRYKGFFGDPETNCQVWHYCDLNGGKASFLCPNGTIFSQVALTCDWWFNVKCSTTAQLYVLNERLYKYILPFTPKFPEDYSGPLVDKYLALKFQEMEEKMKQQRAKGAKQGSSIEIPNAVPDNDEVNGNTLEDNDERYNQNQPYPIKYVTTEAVPERSSTMPPRPKTVVSMPSAPSSAVPVTLEDIEAELHHGMMQSPSSAGSSTIGPSTMPSMSAEQEEDEPLAPANFRTSSVPTTTTLIIATEEPPIDPFHREMMIDPPAEGRIEDEYSNVLNAEHATSVAPPPHLPTAAPILSKIRRIEVKNDGTSGHLVRNPSYDRRRKK